MRSNKTKILDAASQLLLDKGPAGLSVRGIANLAGVSTIGIYSHFDGKQGILDALGTEAYELIYRSSFEASKIADAESALLAGARNYLTMARNNEVHYRLIFGEAAPGYTPGPEASRAARRAFDALITLVSKLDPDEDKEDEIERMAIRFWSLLHGFVSLQHHSAPDFLEVKDWEDQAIEAVRDMIAYYNT